MLSTPCDQSLDAGGVLRRLFQNLMLPDSDHQPTLLPELFRSCEISQAVALDLFAPIADVRLRHVAVAAFGATVPETAIDEDDYLGWPKNKVRLAGQVAMNAIAPHPARGKFSAQRELRFGMPRANA